MSDTSKPSPGRKRKTHCKRGHDLSVYGRPHKNGGRVCKECNRIRNRPDYIPDPGAKPVKRDHAELVRLYQSGEKVRDIAKQTGASLATIYAALDKAKVARRNKKSISVEDIEREYLAMLAEMEEQDG